MQPHIWICTQWPEEAVLQSACAAGALPIEQAVLAALRARGLLTDAECRRCTALLGLLP